MKKIQTGYTPGPWERIGATRVWKTGKNGGAIAIIAEPHCIMSNDIHAVDIGSKRWDEAMANARLIAAAPEMLEALQFAMELIDRAYSGGKLNPGCTIKTGKAISKALGGYETEPEDK